MVLTDGGVRPVSLSPTAPVVAAGRAPVRARISRRACPMRESHGRAASRLAVSRRSRTASRRRTVRSRAASSATVRPLRSCSYCIAPLTGEYGMGGRLERTPGRWKEHRDARQGRVPVTPAPVAAGGFDTEPATYLVSSRRHERKPRVRRDHNVDRVVVAITAGRNNRDVRGVEHLVGAPELQPVRRVVPRVDHVAAPSWKATLVRSVFPSRARPAGAVRGPRRFDKRPRREYATLESEPGVTASRRVREPDRAVLGHWRRCREAAQVRQSANSGKRRRRTRGRPYGRDKALR